MAESFTMGAHSDLSLPESFTRPNLKWYDAGMGTTGRTWRRIPKLSKRPHPQRRLYYSTYTDEESGKQRFEFFSADLKESERLHRLWLLNNYDQPGILPSTVPSGNSSESSFVAMADAFLAHERGRLVNSRVRWENRRQILDITEWFIEKYAGRCHTHALHELMTETDCEEMLRDFAEKLGQSQFAKRRQRFWKMVRFARRKPFCSRLEFDQEDIERIGGQGPRDRQFPPISVLQELLSLCSLQQQCIIWMAIGLGFGQADISICEPQCFDAEDFDLRRAKNARPRYGKMRPLIWAYIRKYLKETGRKAHTLMFLTETGLPLVRIRDKTPIEIERERKESPNREPTPFTRIDTVAMFWRRKVERLKQKRWREGFYVLRHLGATALASRPGVAITELRDFMGHAGASRVTDKYVRPLPPEAKPVVAWINRMLDSSDVDCWKPAPARKSRGKRGRKTPSPPAGDA